MTISFLLRRFCSTRISAAGVWQKYEQAKVGLAATLKPKSDSFRTKRLNPHAVFANNELNLDEVDAYGFDYDYTLAIYTKDVNVLTYNLALTQLIKHFRYPEDLRSMDYDPLFAVRGLHYDVDRGLLMKLDAYCQVQLGTVYRGKQPVSDAEVVQLYNGTYIPDDAVGDNMKQLLDLFSLPELGLLANVAEYFYQNQIDYHPESLYQDVKSAVGQVHIQGHLYRSVESDLSRFVHPSPLLPDLLGRLQTAGKTVFLLTNSPFDFVNHGMTYLVGPDWTSFFDFIGTRARKPKFFDDIRRPFRLMCSRDSQAVLSWQPVRTLERGEVYAEGNFADFVSMAGLRQKNVLYFGDHLYSDLAEPILRRGWRTAAVVPELGNEIEVQTSPEYARSMYWLTTLNNLIDKYQDFADNDEAIAEVINMWRVERRDLRRRAKESFNPNFGSMFRTDNAASYFTRRFVRLADVYTSDVTNFLQYSLRHRFYPRRSSLPHELEWKVLLDD